MQYLKSHMDQKCRPYASKAIREGCNILEIDLQMAQGEIVLGHNFRPPLKMLFDCTLDEYLHRIVESHPGVKVIVQLDIKEICITSKGMEKFAKKIADQLIPYFNGNIEIIVSANSGFNRLKTLEYVRSYLNTSGWPAPIWYEWREGKDIKTVDLWR